MPITKIQNKFHEFLWQGDLNQRSPCHKRIIKLLRIFQAVFHDLSDGLPTLRAMGLVYTTLLAIVPTMAVGFSVLKGFGLHNEIMPVLLHILEPLGAQSERIAIEFIAFVDNIDVGLLGVMGIAFLFYTILALIHKIERAFNYTWHITEYRGLGQRISDYLSVIMIGPILVFTAIAITAAIASSTIINALSNIDFFGLIITATGRILPYLLVIAAFTVIYLLVPNTKVKFRSALIGAFIAGVLWETSGWLFASFIVSSGNYTAVYSSFAILIFFMIWLYLSWLILLIGASISYYHQHPNKILAIHDASILSNRMKEKIALLVMYHIGKNFHNNEKPWTSGELSDVLNVSNELLTEIIQSLEMNKLITRQQDRDISYLPGQSLENISVLRVIESIRCSNESPFSNNDSIHSELAVDNIIKNFDGSIKQSLNHLSIRDLITNHQLDK